MSADRSALTTSQFDTELHPSLRGNHVHCALIYAIDLFEPPTVHRLCANFAELVGRPAADPELRLSQYPVLSSAERETIFNQAAAPNADTMPTARHLSEWVAQRARSFRELLRRADRLAARLRADGVGPESAVGVLVQPGPDFVGALLGVVRAGAAYLPIDPHAPAERVKSMFADASAVRVLRVEDVRENEAELDTGRAPDGRYPPANPHQDNLLYVVYTSGSTGTPKGVAVSHRSFAQLMRWHLARYATDDVVVAATSSVGFDAAGWEIWSALL